jgi:adenylate cyclase
LCWCTISSVDATELEAAGLYDPSASDAADRLALLEYLVSEGVTKAELQAAAAEDRVVAVLGDRLIRPGPAEFSIEEVSARTGLTRDVLTRLWRAAGLSPPPPLERAYSNADVEALWVIQLGVERFGLDAVLQLLRVVGSSLARIAEAEAQMVMLRVPDTFLPTASSAIAAAQAVAQHSTMLTGVGQAYDVLHRHHLEASARRFDAMMPPGATSADTVEVAVGFADLVGFSVLAERLDLGAFADAVRAFVATASDVVAAGGGRVVKLIGDEVMFVAPDAARGIAIGLELLDVFAAHPVLPPVRAAISGGRVVGCDGDYFGSVVNTAARLVSLSEANSLLVTESAITLELRNRYRVTALGALSLRGVERPVEVFRVQQRERDDKL